MKVKELIKILETYDSNLEVYRTEYDESIVPITKVDTYGIIKPTYKLVLEIQ